MLRSTGLSRKARQAMRESTASKTSMIHREEKRERTDRISIRDYSSGGASRDSGGGNASAGRSNHLLLDDKAGKIKVVGSQWVKEWSPTEALSIMENALTANQNKIDAVVVARVVSGTIVLSHESERMEFRARGEIPGPIVPPARKPLRDYFEGASAVID